MKTSIAQRESSRRLPPGGGKAPVRGFRAIGGERFFVAEGEEAPLIDVDGNSYRDYVGSWGSLILGHAHPAEVAALREAGAQAVMSAIRAARAAFAAAAA
ncbi:MAG: aminotransferase class III-fold pyridoxal phosphate-dependent enzyme [candidate division NC10 bacterium]|nr:aminotransferase class III-fold pyridoxal phosphate-dependent enzyme [candidate division NC10 bacterium]